ncbi:hypothetical protein, partial [Bacillus thuringiensis]|uniref:hypothetical protein n=1 Tax=Bacillus thuringiensis TaxID=1428 RepID=UPI001C55541D
IDLRKNSTISPEINNKTPFINKINGGPYMSAKNEEIAKATGDAILVREPSVPKVLPCNSGSTSTLIITLTSNVQNEKSIPKRRINGTA